MNLLWRGKVGVFLRLFPQSTRTALIIAIVAACFLATFDFFSLLLLLPVFGELTSGGGGQAVPQIGPLREVSTGVLLILAMGLMIFRSVGAFVHRFWWGQRVARAELALSSRLLHAYAFAPYEFHLRRNSSELLSRAVSHVNVAATAGLNSLVTMTSDATTVIGMTAALFVASPVAALYVTGYLMAVGGVFVLISRKYVAGHSRRFAEQVSKVYSRGTTVLRGIRELTVADGRKAALDSIDESRDGMVIAQRNLLVLNDVPRLILETALYLAILFALLIVLSRDDSSESLPVVALYVVAGLRILPAIGRALGGLTSFRTGCALGADVSEELASVESQGTQRHSPGGALPRVGRLDVDDVTFCYRSDDAEQRHAVLEGVSFSIPFGSMVGIVGPSGAGKSTLLGLLLGLLEPESGRITFGGEPIGLADQNWLQHVGYVPQDVFLLDDTVLNNVALGDSSPDLGRAHRAIERASLSDTIGNMADGLQTSLGEGGSRLSVGQRQRLGIARALYREPSVLILDEPTAALDNATESSIMETINGFAGEVTIVMVAHRVSTLAAVDFIINVSRESGVEIGSIEQFQLETQR